MLKHNTTKIISFIGLIIHATCYAKFPTWTTLSPENNLHIVQLNKISQPQKLILQEQEAKANQISRVQPLVAPYYLHYWVRPNDLAQDKTQKILLPAKNGKTFEYQLYHPKKINSFVIGSCTHQSYDLNLMQQVWQSVYNSQPDVIILAGDNVYSDYSLNYKIAQTPDNLTRAFIHALERIPLYHHETLIPIISTWDDHDFGIGDGNKNFPLKSSALFIFQAIYSPWTKINPSAIYQKYLSLNPDYDLYLLDARSDRDPNGGADHLGLQQLNWLEQSLKNSSKKSLVIKGDQFFGAYHRFESYERNHPNEFNQFLNIIKKSKPTPILISGDRHLSEFQILFKETSPIHEWTSSPMHSKLFPKTADEKRTDNPHRLWVEDAKLNFMKFSLDKKLKVEVIDHLGNVLYKKNYD
jgi:alkaline phosphatase D